MRPRLRLLVALLAPVFLAVSGANAQISANFGGASGGSVIPGNDSNACSSTNNGAIRYTGSQFQVCYGSGGWAALPDASGTVAGLSSDRITSGTAGIFVSNTGIINLRTGGVTTGYFDASGLLVAPGISITTGNGISSTNGYFSGTVGVGTNQPSATLHIMGGAGGSDVIRLSRPDASNVYGIGIANNAFNIYNEAPAGTARVLNFMLNGTGLLIGVLPNSQASVPSTTLHVSGTVRVTSWTMLNANATPTVPLEVSGTVSATAFVGNGAGLTNLNVQGDRITSGTAGVFVSNTGVINFRTGGVTTGYFDASGLLVAPGISITTGNGISSTSGYFSQKSFFGENASALASSVSASHIISGTLYIAPSISYASSNDGFLTVKASTGGAFFVGRQAGGGYSSNKGIFTALTDNSNGAANLFFIGLTSGTTTSFIRADGLAYFASRLGVGVASPSVASAVEVSGTVSATAFVGNGAGLTNLNVQGDRITSGTAGVFVSSTGIINFRTGGVTTGYFDTAGVLVAPGISLTTTGISSTNGYFSGAIITAPRDNASTSINWAQGNVQRTSSSCGAFTFSNMQDGGAYTLTIEGTTAGTCSFSHSGLTFRMPPDHGAVSTGTMTLYTFLRSGTNVFVNWTPGY